MAYVYRAKTEKNGTKKRIMWGKIYKAHGNSGCVRARFQRNLPAQSLGETVRVMLFPSRI